MALLKCIECGHDVSEYAQACPHCGCPVNVIKQKFDEEIHKTHVALRLCNECGKKIANNAVKCSYCGCSIKQPHDEMLCKINGVEYDLSDVWKEIMSMEDKNVWIVDGELAKSIQDVFNLTELADPDALCEEIAKTGIVPREYNGISMKEFKKQQQEALKKTASIRCPYCGSINVKPLGLFDGGWSAVGNNWKCKNCKSYF